MQIHLSDEISHMPQQNDLSMSSFYSLCDFLLCEGLLLYSKSSQHWHMLQLSTSHRAYYLSMLPLLMHLAKLHPYHQTILNCLSKVGWHQNSMDLATKST
ncbi:hypothetical protein AAHE18_02G147800 [Arachis hypogaea]